MNNIPQVRHTERVFTLCYVRKVGFRPNGIPSEIMGFTIALYFGRQLTPKFILSSCTENWIPVDNRRFDTYQYLFLVAEVFYNINLGDWIGCHPLNGEKLYAQPRSNFDKLHRKLLKEIDSFRSLESLSKVEQRHAYYAGVT